MEKKTKQLTKGDMVKNILNGKFYAFESCQKFQSGYIVKLEGREDGCEYYADYNDRHEVQA